MNLRVKYYLTSSGRNPVEEFIRNLPHSTQLELFDAIDLLAQGRNLRMPLSRNLSSIYPGLHELRFRDQAGQIRVFYLLKRLDGIFLLHAFRKKSQEIPRKELNLILKRLREI